jgi:hypothetical protein
MPFVSGGASESVYMKGRPWHRFLPAASRWGALLGILIVAILKSRFGGFASKLLRWAFLK